MARIANGNPQLFARWTDNDAWMAGLIWSDGCLNIQDNHHRIMFSSTDMELAQLAGYIAGITPRAYSGHSNDGCHRKPYYVVNIGRQEVVRRIVEIGLIPRKSIEIGFPSGLPDNALAPFVRGYFDGNGCVGLYRNPSKTRCPIPRLKVKFTGAGSVLEGIQHVMETRAGISRKKLTKAGSVWQLNYNHRDSLALHGFMYSDECLCLSRKRLIFLEGASQPFTSR